MFKPERKRNSVMYADEIEEKGMWMGEKGGGRREGRTEEGWKEED
jgi:hypothetical protein